MKIVDLKCPSCGGKLIPVEGNSKIVCCEYCKSQFVLEDDRVINYHIHQYGDVGQPGNYASDKGGPVSKYAWLAVPFVIAAFTVTSIIIGINKAPDPPPAHAVPSVAVEQPGGIIFETEEANPGGSPLYLAMVEAIFEKPADSVTPEDLGKIKYLSVQGGSEETLVEYSFADPYGEGFAPQILRLPDLTWRIEDAAAFIGLVKLDAGRAQVGEETLKKLGQLKGLACYRASFTELARSLTPGQIVELAVRRPESLEGVSAFEHLESLTLDGIAAPDFKQLVPLKQLKSLTVIEDVPEEGGALTDYGALSVLTGLETLCLDSEAIREFSFLKPLSKLTSLSLEGTEAIGIEPLGELTQLVSLSLKDNDSVKDYSPLGSLTGLRSLVLDKDSSEPDPELSSLGNLEELEISGVLSVSVLKNLGSLKKLCIHGCNMDEAPALSSLTGLEELACYSIWASGHALKDLRFTDGMVNLKRLSLCNVNGDDFFSGYGNSMEIYGDISNVFNHPGLEELYLSDCLVGIDFGQIKENPTLKKLWMDGISVKENFYVESYNGMTDVWYDDVNFDEHTGFLTHFPGLEELKLDGNQLTNIGFAASLTQLNSLSIYDNYVTDLAPLNQAGRLKYLDIRKNPVNNAPAEKEGMVILK